MDRNVPPGYRTTPTCKQEVEKSWSSKWRSEKRQTRPRVDSAIISPNLKRYVFKREEERS